MAQSHFSGAMKVYVGLTTVLSIVALGLLIWIGMLWYRFAPQYEQLLSQYAAYADQIQVTSTQQSGGSAFPQVLRGCMEQELGTPRMNEILGGSPPDEGEIRNVEECLERMETADLAP